MKKKSRKAFAAFLSVLMSFCLMTANMVPASQAYAAEIQTEAAEEEVTDAQPASADEEEVTDAQSASTDEEMAAPSEETAPEESADESEEEKQEVLEEEDQETELEEIQESEPVLASADAVGETIAEWTFTAAPEEGLPVQSTTGNGTLDVTGAEYTGYSSKSLAAKAWNADDGYWLISGVDAAGCSDMTFSAQMRSSGTGPANFELQYQIDGTDTWTALENGRVKITGTALSSYYSGLALPAELSGQKFSLRLKITDSESLNGGTVASSGASNINNIEIAGNGSDAALTCAAVTAAPEAGEVEKDTQVTLGCTTEGAVIKYKLNDAAEYSDYTEPITITESTTVYAHAELEGYQNSAEATFAYTVPEEAEKEASLATELKDGNVVVLYYENGDEDGLVMSGTASGKKLTGVIANPADGKLAVPDGAAEMTVSIDANGYYTFICDGKYLTSEPTGNGVKFSETESEYSLWTLEEPNDDGAFLIANVNAKYNTSNQYLEYYSGFTTFSYRSNNDKVYRFHFYLVEEGTPAVKIDVDSSVSMTVAQWAGNADYDDAGTTAEGGIKGDLYKTNDMLDENAVFSAVVNGASVVPYTAATSTATGSTSYYMGGKGLGSGTDDYMQLALSSFGYGKMSLSFRLRASNTGAGSFQLQYSSDGENFKNFTTGTYAYQYTSYSSGGASTDVKKNGEITDGVAKTSLAPGYYIDFSFDVPDAASHAEVLYIRLVPGKENAKGTGNAGTGGVVRIDSVVLTGSPVIADDICGYVKADPESGAASVGDAVTLTTETEGAQIHYSIDGGEDQVYDAQNRIKLDKLPTAITAYAVKDGLKNSIVTTYQYTPAQVTTVKASPNGGAVVKGKLLTLTCDTQGALIQYSSDEGKTWTDYTEPFALDTLPVTYQVKAVKEGYVDSSILTLSFTERENDKYNIYFGQLHSHTSYSDGAGSCEDAFQHATNVDNLDFLAVTDHSNSFDNADSASLADGYVSEEWTEGQKLADKYTTENFVSLFGFEMTWSNGLGHMNTFNTDGFQSRTQTEYSTYSTALQNYYATLKTEPDSISQFNHPGTTFGDFSDFAYYDETIDDLITTIEVGNGEGAIGSSGYFPSYEYYQRALDKGWHVAPTNNQDNHKGLWGDANTGRSVALADSLTKENIYDAMRNYRIYATEDNDLSIYYTLDDYEMGSILSSGQTGDTVELKVELSDPTDSSIGKVQVITNGGLVLAEEKVSGNEETVKFTVDNNYSYYYIKVVENDGDIAVTAPVWVGTVEAVGINNISTDEVLPVKGEPLNVKLDLYNNENTALQIDSITFEVDGQAVHTADLAEAGLTSLEAMSTGSYEFSYTYDKVGSMEINAVVNATLKGASKIYKGVLKLNYVTPNMVTKVLIDGTHYNDYVTGYYGANVGNFTTIAGEKSIKVEVVTDQITPEMLDDCSLLIISAPAKRAGTANAGDYVPSHFSDDFIAMVKDYTDKGGTLIACGIADYQDTANGQTTTEMNKLLSAIGATTKLNSDEAYDEVNNGGQPYRLYLKGTFNADSPYLAGASAEQEYSAYSGCTVSLDEGAVAAGKAEALVRGYDTTYSIDSKDENGGYTSGNPVYVEKGDVVVLAHETLDSGANIFVAGTVFISDFEVKAELDNIWDLPYLNRTIAENIMSGVAAELPVTGISEVRKGEMGDVYRIEGYVTSGTSTEGNTFFDTIYVQDETGGITVFPYSAEGLEIGTRIQITGYVDAYQGDREIQIMSYKIIPGDTKVYEPEKMTAKDAMDYDKSGGRLVKVEGKVADVLYDASGKGVSQFWLDDGSGVNANIFIDGYILSGTTGKNELASTVKIGDTVSAVGLVYAHPEGESDVPITCLRVRNCDEIAAAEDQGGEDKPGTDEPDKPGTNEPGTTDKPGTDKPGTTDKPGADEPGTTDKTDNSGGSSSGKGSSSSSTASTVSASSPEAANGAMTGDQTPIGSYIVLLASTILLLVIFAVQKKRQKEN